MKRGTIYAGGVGLCVALAATPVFAQTFANEHESGPRENELPLMKPIDDMLAKYADFGINIRGGVVNEVSRNPTGGVKQATWDTGQGQLGADFDLQRLLGLPGASIHITEYHDFGRSLSVKAIGTYLKVQEIYKNPYTDFHFGLFAYEQKLFDDRLDLTGGRLGATNYFAHTEYSCRFMSGATCGTPVIFNSETGATLLPSATWGATGKYSVTPNIYVSAGAFEVNPNIQPSSGLDWRTDAATGVTIPAEIGYQNRTEAYPTEIKVGASYGNGKHSDPYQNTAGKSLGLYGGTARSVEDREDAWVMGSKQIYHLPGGSNESHYVALVGGALQTFDSTEIYHHESFLGAVLVGPFAARPKDSVGFNLSYFRVSADEIAYLRDARIRNGGYGVNNPNQFGLELNYIYVPYRGMEIMPDLQYLIHPENSALPNTTRVSNNAWVIGLKAEAVFGDTPFAPHGRSGENRYLRTTDGDNPSEDHDPTSEVKSIDPRSWNGLYAGPQIGYSFGLDDRIGTSTRTGAALFTNISAPKDVIYGGHIGYNLVVPTFRLMGGAGLLGVEGDTDGTSGMKKYTLYQSVSGTYRDTIQGSVRGRVGLDFGKYLAYATAGIGFGNLRNTYTTTKGGYDPSITVRRGYTVGAGAEYALNARWAARLEYRHTGFDDANQVLTTTEGGLVAVRHQDSDNLVQAGLSYRFNPPPPPVVAKY